MIFWYLTFSQGSIQPPVFTKIINSSPTRNDFKVNTWPYQNLFISSWFKPYSIHQTNSYFVTKLVFYIHFAAFFFNLSQLPFKSVYFWLGNWQLVEFKNRVFSKFLSLINFPVFSCPFQTLTQFLSIVFLNPIHLLPKMSPIFTDQTSLMLTICHFLSMSSAVNPLMDALLMLVFGPWCKMCNIMSQAITSINIQHIHDLSALFSMSQPWHVRIVWKIQHLSKADVVIIIKFHYHQKANKQFLCQEVKWTTKSRSHWTRNNFSGHILSN